MPIVHVLDTDGFVYALHASPNYVYLADKQLGLVVVNVSNVNNPHIMGNYKSNSAANSIFLRGSYAFMTNGEGLEIIQVAP